MEISDSLKTRLTLLQRLIRIAYGVFPTLFGLFMVLWGIFLNNWDWLLIGAGLFIFLLFGGCMYRVVTGEESG